ncbi:MAG: protein-tyrosine phosphatase [Bacteroidia bacterium]|jgi:protein-tyrosine phosphatase
MAEGLFLHLIREREFDHQFEVDSAGTAGYHIGERPDHRMVETAQSHGVNLPSNARQFTVSDFANYDVIVPMDDENVTNIESLRPKHKTRAKVLKMRDFDDTDKGGNVPDPYYGGTGGFEEVFQLLLRSNSAFIDYLEKNS